MRFQSLSEFSQKNNENPTLRKSDDTWMTCASYFLAKYLFLNAKTCQYRQRSPLCNGLYESGLWTPSKHISNKDGPKDARLPGLKIYLQTTSNSEGRPGASASQQWEVQLSARYRQWTPQEKRRLKSWKHYPCLSVAPLKCSSLFWGDLNYKRFQFMPKFDCKEGLSCLPQIGGKATHFKTLGVFTGHCTCTQTFWETRYLRRSAREIAWKTILLHCTLLIKFVQVQRSIQ